MSSAPRSIELTIPADHPAFAGHFPGNPIVPGVVLLDEAVFAIGAATGAADAPFTLTQVKFRQVLRPGEPLTLRFEAAGERRFRFEFESRGRGVASGTLVFDADPADAA
jgi:3-hydroxymyristoyl/3-hydroxydecanoyl-(acyl carrier protein) dehydratase